MPVRGEYNIVEGYGELDIPILKDSFVQSLDANMAGRMTSYSTSGLVETWKLGLTSQINDDIRAPRHLVLRHPRAQSGRIVQCHSRFRRSGRLP